MPFDSGFFIRSSFSSPQVQHTRLYLLRDLLHTFLCLPAFDNMASNKDSVSTTSKKILIKTHIILLSLTPILTWNYRHAIGALLLIFPSLPSIISSFMVCLKIESDPDQIGIF